MIGGQDDNAGGMLADINITPLVDVMLVLLVIFMVTAPLLVPQSLGIDLPKTSAVKAPPPTSKGRLLIDRDGQLQLDEAPILVSELPQKLAGKAQDADYALSIEADEKVLYGRVAEVLAIARSAGVSNIALVTALQVNSN